MQITKEYFDTALQRYTQELIEHFNCGQGQLRIEMSDLKGEFNDLKDGVARVELALEDYLHTDKVVHTLVGELKQTHHLSLPKTSRLLAK